MAIITRLTTLTGSSVEEVAEKVNRWIRNQSYYHGDNLEVEDIQFLNQGSQIPVVIRYRKYEYEGSLGWMY